MEEWMWKTMEFAEMTKLAALIKEMTLSNFNADWKPLVDFLGETEKRGNYYIWL